MFRRALHSMHRVEDRRSPWRTAHRIVLTALALVGLLLVGTLTLLLSGPLAQAVGRPLGVGATAAWVWGLLRWPLLVCLVALLVVVVFHTGPVSARRRAHSMPGGVLAAMLWLAVSAGFSLYASTLAAYNRLYGSLAGIVVFLVWLWLSNLALLTGAQFAAELAKSRGRARRRPWCRSSLRQRVGTSSRSEEVGRRRPPLCGARSGVVRPGPGWARQSGGPPSPSGPAEAAVIVESAVTG